MFRLYASYESSSALDKKRNQRKILIQYSIKKKPIQYSRNIRKSEAASRYQTIDHKIVKIIKSWLKIYIINFTIAKSSVKKYDK